NILTAMSNRTVSIVRNIVSSVVRFFTNLFNSGRQIFTNLRTTVVNSISRMRDGVVNGVSRMRDRTLDVYRNLKDKAAGYLTDMVDGAKQLPGKLGSAISNGASKAVDGVKSLGNKMTGKLGSVVNGIIGGLNSITGKIGITSTISKWNVPTFSTGTGQGSPSGKLTKNGKIAMDTLATVGDKGKGNGKGTRELVRYPNGKVGLYDNDATIFAPKGTTIFSNRETEAMLGQIPKFSEGTGLWGKIKNIASKAVDYITNPKKIFDDLISAVGENFGDMTGFAGNFIKGAWSMIKDGMFGWIKGKFSEASVGKSQKWMDYKMTTPYSPNAPVPGYPTSFNGGRHYGIDYGTPVGVNITAPMAGTVSRMSDRGGGNVARLDASGNAAQYFMHMNSVKTGKVGIGDSVGKSGNTGEWTTGPHVHWQHEDPSASYIQNRNTKNPLSMVKGHLKGGQILSDGLFNLHKGEYVINPNEPTEAMKLLAIVGKKLAGKSKQTRE
ncbi:M23 family metallopeptidase, partial [Salinicoccus sp. YB14-2]|uniref:M23 family metallopeptidase n=1 Tax=Salinicoccus sp. YB14-2 TaxID=1572701 RepID=UPI0018D131D8